jgi:L-aspartate oxidase
MSHHAAVTRSAEGLVGAAEAIAELAAALGGRGPFAIETRNLLVNAALAVSSATLREESRGTHFRRDHPERDDRGWRGHLVWRRGEGAPTLAPVTEPETIPQPEAGR